MNVGEVAALTGVTVRTLHHYDRIGLLSPSGRTASGYRKYSAADLDRLHSVLVYRELGFPLEEVATLLDDPDADPMEHLRRQRRLLHDRVDRDQRLIAAVEKEMEARSMAIQLTPEERFEVFGDQDPAQYGAEVEARWGDSELLAESRRRTSRYGKEDWLRINAEAADVEQRLASALRNDVPADSAAAMDLAEEHRQQISRNFYDCAPDVHVALGQMYVEDARFTAHYDAIEPGLARFVNAAIEANAARRSA